MKQLAIILICIALGACSKKVKELVSPPDDVSGHSSSVHIGTDSSASSQSSLTAPPLSSSQGAQSSMAVGSASSQASSASSGQTEASSSVGIGLGGSSSEDSMPTNGSSSVAASSSSASSSFSSMPAASSSQAASASSESASSDAAVGSPHGEDMFMAMCNDCHNLAEQAPFQIGNNLSLAELTETINNTMPFRNADACTGTCADDLAYYISEMLSRQ